MKATLIAAAFLIPTLVLGADPTTKETKATGEKETYGQTKVKSPSEVLTKLHKLSQKGIEKATFAQATASNEDVKEFAERQLKDYQKLDKSVLDVAKDKKITLSAVGTGTSKETKSEYGSTTESRSGTPTTRTEEPGTTPAPETDDTMGQGAGTSQPRERTDDDTLGTTGSTTGTDTSTGAVGSGTTGGTGTTTQMGTAGDTRTGTATETETETTGETRAGTATGKMGEMEAELDPEWERLRTLSGSQFDAEYLSSTIDNAQQNLTMLQEIGKTGDRKLDKVVNDGIKLFRDHQKRAEKLQRDLPAT